MNEKLSYVSNNIVNSLLTFCGGKPLLNKGFETILIKKYVIKTEKL